MLAGKYDKFLAWCYEHGVKAPKIEYPVEFENGLMGARVKEDIGHKEAFMMVPHKLWITSEDTEEHPVLKPIIEAHPTVFQDDEGEHSGHKLLILRVFYEWMIGQDSFWKPWIDILPEINLQWDNNDLEELHDRALERRYFKIRKA